MEQIGNNAVWLIYTVSPTLKRYSWKLHWSILMTFGRNIQNTLE